MRQKYFTKSVDMPFRFSIAKNEENVIVIVFYCLMQAFVVLNKVLLNEIFCINRTVYTIQIW
jgi:hypothetical protein